MALDAEQDDENQNLSDDDPAAWVAKMRNRRSEPRLQKSKEIHAKKRAVRNSSGNIEYSMHDLNGLKVDHAEEDLEGNEQTILTLKDTNVLMDVDDKNEDHEDVLQSVDVLQRKETKRRQSADSATYDPTDNKEFARKGLLHDLESTADKTVENRGLRIGANGLPSKGEDGAGQSAIGGGSVVAAAKKSSIEEQLSLSIALDEKRQFQEDYDLSEHVERGFSRRKKSKHGKSKKRKRHIEAELRDALNGDGSSGHAASGKLPPRPLSRVSSIRSKAMEKIAKEDHEDDAVVDDAQSILHASLRKAREKARNSDVDASVKRILKIIDQAEENAGKEGDNFDDVSANIIFNEMEQYVRNIPTAESIPDESSEEEDVMVVDSKVAGQESLDVQENAVDTIVPKSSEEKPNPAPAGLVEEKVDSVQNRISDMGVASALARFRAMGDLRSRPEQQGRARDERIDWKELDSKVPVPAGQRNIKLTYTDESGHELTPKEAFRLMCHKFHGKGPSRNKRELRLRRQLQKMRLQQMANDDTPLGSGAALRDETSRTGGRACCPFRTIRGPLKVCV